jgi:hypothetical protein
MKIFHSLRIVEHDVAVMISIEKLNNHFIWTINIGNDVKNISLGGETNNLVRALISLRNFLLLLLHVLEDALQDVKEGIEIAGDNPVGGMDNIPENPYDN